jgi:GT2 family glycosyltransferase
MKISIVVCTKGRYEDLVECLSAIRTQLFVDSEVIVVDGDGDSAVSTICLLNGFVYVNQKKFKAKMCTPAARNLGVKFCSGDIVVFIDDDALPAQNWLLALRNCYLSKKPAAVGGPVISTVNSSRISPDKYKNSLIRIIFKKLLREDTLDIGRFFSSGLVTENWDIIPRKNLEVQNLLGTNMSFDRKWIKTVGTFDEFIDSCGVRDETDLCLRVVENGGKILYCPEVLVYHKLSPKSESSKRLYFKYFTDFYFLFKHRRFLSMSHFLMKETLLFGYLIYKSKPIKGKKNPWTYALRGRIDGYLSIVEWSSIKGNK